MCYVNFFGTIFVSFCFVFSRLGLVFVASELYFLNHQKSNLVLCCVIIIFNFV
jgi:hypothetical protein